MLTFTCDGAFEAKSLIENCFDQAYKALFISVEQKNLRRVRYWIERVIHFINELNEIDKIIIGLKKADSEKDRPNGS